MFNYSIIYQYIKVFCVCGNNFITKSTTLEDIYVDTCKYCHPFYTNTQKFLDTEGRIDRFNKRFHNYSKLKLKIYL